jgi:histone H3/H4
MPRHKTMPSKNAGAPLKSKAAAAATETVVARKKRRWKAGTVATREIRQLQLTTDLVIPRRSFQRFVREIIQNRDVFSASRRVKRITMGALESLQEATEAFVSEAIGNAQIICAEMGGKKTLTVEGLRIASTLLLNKGTIPVDKRPRPVSINGAPPPATAKRATAVKPKAKAKAKAKLEEKPLVEESVVEEEDADVEVAVQPKENEDADADDKEKSVDSDIDDML